MNTGEGFAPYTGTELIYLPGATGPVAVLRAEGAVGADHPLFAALRAHRTQASSVIADLSLVNTLSEAGRQELARCAREFAPRDLHLVVAGGGPAQARVTAPPGRVHATIAAAVEAAAPRGPQAAPDLREEPPGEEAAGGPDGFRSPADPGRADGEEAEELRRQVRQWRARALTHPLISQAQGILQERYQLADPQAAFRLLSEASQKHNVRLRALSARCERSRRNPSSLASRSTLSPPSPRSVSTAAISAADLAAPNDCESTIIRASRGGSASARRLSPSAVIRPSPSSAPSSRNRLRASFSAGAGGASRNDSVAGSLTPHWATSSSSEDRSALRISGWV